MASLLETFFILFDSNADKVKKGADDAKRSTNDLDDSLTQSDRNAQALGDSITSAFKAAALGFAAAFGGNEIKDLVLGQAELNEQLGVTSKRLGIQVEDLDAWGQAAQRSGGSAEGLYQTLDFLNKGMADIATKGTSRLKPFFDELKIKVTDGPKQVRPLLDILGDLSDKLSKMGAQQAAGIGEKLGIDPGVLIMLQSGRRGVEDLVQRQKELGVATEADTEAAHKFEMSLQDLEQQGRHLATGIGSVILPYLERFFDWVGKIVDYLSGHKELVEGFFIGVAGAITAYYLPAVIDGIVATIAFLAPWLLLIGIIAAIGAIVGLVFDDIKNYMEGHKSVIGEIEKRWPKIAEAVREFGHVVGEVFAYITDLAEAFGGLAAAVFTLVFGVWKIGAHYAAEAFGVFMGVARAGVNWFLKTFPWVGDAFKGLVEGFQTYGKVIGAIWDWIVDRVKNAADIIRGLTKGISAISVALGITAAAPSLAHPATVAAINTAQVALAGVNGTNVPVGHTHKTLSLSTGPITINTQATDAPGILHDFSTSLHNEMRQALDHFDDGVQR